MSGFWTGWVVFFVLLNGVLVTFLFIYAIRVRIPVDADGTTGHVWAHGAIREGVRRLPRWWVLMSAAFLVFAVVYLVRYPGLGGFPGTLGWDSVEQVERARAANAERRADLLRRVRTQPLAALAADPQVVRAGDALFGDNCAACHGVNGEGNQTIGAPDLTDDAWLYGDSDEALRTSLVAGRKGVMPAFGEALGERGVREVAAYVYELNGRDWPREDLVAAGRERFQTLCVSCHGADGTGNTQLGAPNLTDDSWLYGGRLETIMAGVRDGRQGVMPGWEGRLADEEIRILMAWVRAAGAGDGGMRGE
ncbi:MAG: cytochrome-c oxidase, cbb3-type subunit III [Halofilum sp. (in: g-proteobacteria)]|nr:cytochrome-c oxidase, cbb3-type subunit III [Halofilum sp. (in: g-proteobacteria)]